MKDASVAGLDFNIFSLNRDQSVAYLGKVGRRGRRPVQLVELFVGIFEASAKFCAYFTRETMICPET